MEHHNFVNLCVEGVLDAMDAPGSYDIERRWTILATLPSLGELFPSLANARPGDRALGDYTNSNP